MTPLFALWIFLYGDGLVRLTIIAHFDVGLAFAMTIAGMVWVGLL